MKSVTLFFHPLRREILNLIENSNGVHFGDIVKNMQRSSSTILRHIIELKKDGFVTKEEQGGKFISLRKK